MNNLKDIHNLCNFTLQRYNVVLSGCQWTILLQKYKKSLKSANLLENILILQKKVVPLQQQIWRIYTIRIIPLCKHSGWYASIALFLFANNNINSKHKNSISSALLSARENFFLKKTTSGKQLIFNTSRLWSFHKNYFISSELLTASDVFVVAGLS